MTAPDDCRGTVFPELQLFEAVHKPDARGWFMEVWQQRRHENAGVACQFVQDNTSYSHHGVLRGMHYQKPHAQSKLITVLTGSIFDVCVDIRIGSPTFGRWFGCPMSSDNQRQLLVPAGFAHGFLVTSDAALVMYKCSDYFVAEAARTVLWNDPAIGIEWPFAPITISPSDRGASRLSEIPPDQLPRMAP
jgi:dTDP-4-dehydrorhamnose 3,5-epimerase